MPIPDDERFETYLKQFRPLVPDALPLAEQKQTPHRHAVLRLWVAGLAALVVLGGVTFHIFNSHGTHQHWAHHHSNAVPVYVDIPEQPLTIRDANALLNAAPSYKSVVDSMAFRNQGSTISKDKQSTLAVLSKERVKL